MTSFNKKGVSLLAVLILVVVFGLIIGGGFVLINIEKAKTRDARRLSDITRIQAAFEFLYNDTADYSLAAQGGCNEVGALVSTCNLKQYLPSIGQFADPGKYKYVISKVPADDGYAVTFTLEKSYYNLLAGKHTLTQNGIK